MFVRKCSSEVWYPKTVHSGTETHQFVVVLHAFVLGKSPKQCQTLFRVYSRLLGVFAQKLSSELRYPETVHSGNETHLFVLVLDEFG